MTRSTSTNLIVALDVESADKAREHFARLRAHTSWFKIGAQLFTAAGPPLVRDIVTAGGKVFLDLKFHDIPNTVASAAREATRLGVSIFNVHASGGAEMMRRAAEAAAETAEREGVPRPRVIAVTILTSHDEQSLAAAGFDSRLSLDDHVLRFAEQASRANLDGVVASVHEAQRIKESLGADFTVVAPGVRPANADRGDQRRVATPTEAARAGVDHIVVGRAILNQPDPVEMVGRIKLELSRADM